MDPAPPVEPRIVLLDDDDDSREPFAMFLRMKGFAVDEYATAEETLESVARAVPRVVVMDISLGQGIDGYELARRLRAAPASRAVRLVAMTGHSADTVKGEGELFDAIVTKPVDADQLVRIVGDLVHARG